MIYQVIEGTIDVIKFELLWCSEHYDNFHIHGGISEYDGHYTVLVSYRRS